MQSAMLMNGTAFVIAKMLPETNYYTCSRSGQMNKTAIILSCKILWCWISDAWSAVFKMTSDGLNQTLSSAKLQHEQRRASSYYKLNWSVGKHSIQYKRIQTKLEHSRKTFGNQLVMFLLACMFNVWTFKTERCCCRAYYISYGTTLWTILPFKKCDGTAVFLSFSIAILP